MHLFSDFLANFLVLCNNYDNIKQKTTRRLAHECTRANSSSIRSIHSRESKFTEKGIKASAARARKALGELGKLAKERRKEIQDEKNV